MKVQRSLGWIGGILYPKPDEFVVKRKSVSAGLVSGPNQKSNHAADVLKPIYGLTESFRTSVTFCCPLNGAYPMLRGTPKFWSFALATKSVIESSGVAFTMRIPKVWSQKIKGIFSISPSASTSSEMVGSEPVGW